ncbi:MAG: sulfatase [Candidatus Brocadiia bacterium]
MSGQKDEETGKSRPNIVWFMCDQLRWDAVGFTGNNIVSTPNLDRIADMGTVFEQAYVQSPVCVTSRACMLTGRYLQNLNMANGCAVLDPWEVTVPQLFQQAGYATGMFGKLHLTPQQYTRDELNSDRPITNAEPFLEPAGFQAPMPGEPYRQNYGFQEVVGFEDALWGEYIDWLEKRDESLGRDVRKWKHGGEDTGVFDGVAPGSPLGDTGAVNIPAELHPSSFIAESAVEFFQRRHDEQPCFMHVSFVDPHHPWDPPAEIARHYPPDEMPLPRQESCPIEWPQSLAERASDFSDVTPELTRTVTAYYYAMIETIDRAVGRVVEAIEEAGELQNTIFVFVADHGELLGDYGLFRKGSYHFDCMMRTPCLLSAPGMLPQGRRVKGLIESIDLAPTLLSVAGVESHAGMQGKDMAPALRSGDTIGKDRVYCEMYTAPWGPYVTCWTLRTEGAKLNYYPQDEVGHLFDLNEDPEEIRDLWALPAYRKLRDEMMAGLLRAQHEQADPLPRILSQY